MQRGIPPETRTFAEEAKVVFPPNLMVLVIYLVAKWINKDRESVSNNM